MSNEKVGNRAIELDTQLRAEGLTPEEMADVAGMVAAKGLSEIEDLESRARESIALFRILSGPLVWGF